MTSASQGRQPAVRMYKCRGDRPRSSEVPTKTQKIGMAEGGRPYYARYDGRGLQGRDLRSHV